MIQANELRIGNCVTYYGKPLQFKSFFGLCNVESKPEGFEPIPLTEEILLKCGFQKIDGNEYYDFYELEDFRVLLGKKNKSIFMQWNLITIESTINNLPLHKLQNICYYLGQELEINL